MRLQVWRPAGAVIGGDLDLVTHVDTEFHVLPERTLILDDEVHVDDGVEMVGSWEDGHGWDPLSVIETLTGKPMQRPRRWPPCEPLAAFQARMVAWNLLLPPEQRDEIVTVDG